jgi:starch phosphorylase
MRSISWRSGFVAQGDAAVFQTPQQALTPHDAYLVLTDVRARLDQQTTGAAAWRDAGRWSRRSVLDVTRLARFSSARAIAEYACETCRVAPMPVG